jgi:hypothetical protein
MILLSFNMIHSKNLRQSKLLLINFRIELYLEKKDNTIKQFKIGETY